MVIVSGTNRKRRLFFVMHSDISWKGLPLIMYGERSRQAKDDHKSQLDLGGPRISGEGVAYVVQ